MLDFITKIIVENFYNSETVEQKAMFTLYKVRVKPMFTLYNNMMKFCKKIVAKCVHEFYSTLCKVCTWILLNTLLQFHEFFPHFMHICSFQQCEYCEIGNVSMGFSKSLMPKICDLENPILIFPSHSILSLSPIDPPGPTFSNILQNAGPRWFLSRISLLKKVTYTSTISCKNYHK